MFTYDYHLGMADPSNTPYVKQAKSSVANDQAQTCGDQESAKEDEGKCTPGRLKHCQKYDLC